MRVVDKFDGNGTKFSFELLPPLRGSSIESVYQTIEPLREFSPGCISITYHREETVFSRLADGSVQKKLLRKRPGTVGIATAIQHKYGLDVVPHIICGGFTRRETEEALIDLDFLGIHNLLVLRGDGDKVTGKFTSNKDGHANAVHLVNQIRNMNNGIYLESFHSDPSHTNFSVGVAGYPEKHFEAPSFESDLLYLKKKIDAGAEYIVTQMFFDNRVYYEFVKRCRAIGINVPIVPGLKPLALRKHLEMLPKIFGISIPKELSREISSCKTDNDVYTAGIEWAISQSADLKQAGVPAIHYYTMSRPDNIVAIARHIF